MDNLIKLIPKQTELNGVIAFEKINMNKLNLLLNSNLLLEIQYNPLNPFKSELCQLQKYKKNLVNSENATEKGLIRVEYVRTVNMPNFGRVNPKKSLGLHSLRREIRATICEEYFIDIDIINCHPNIAYQISKKINVDCPNLKKYCKNRDSILNDIQQNYKINRKESKQLIITLLNLGSYKKWLTINDFKIEMDFLTDLSKEVNILSKSIIKNNPELHNLCKKKEPSTTALYYQTIENDILNEIYNYCITKGIIKNMYVLSNDGLMIPKENFKPELLIEFKKIIKEKFNLKLDFINKILDNSYSMETLKKAQYKTQLIDTYFNEIDISSHNFWANKFYELFDEKEKYIYSVDKGWYEYNKYNILMCTGKNPPLNLNRQITNVLIEDLKNNYIKMVSIIPPEKEEFKTYTKIYKSNYKNLGSSTYKEGIIKELLYNFNDSELEKKLDQNNNLIVFKNKLFDFENNIYRSIEKNDFCVNHINYEAPENKDDNIINELNNILVDIFENDEIKNYFLDTISFSLFTNEFEKFYLWSGSGGNGKGMLMNLISNALNTYFLIPNNDFLTSNNSKSETNPSLSKCEFKKIVMVSEPKGGDNGDIKFNLEFIKQITGRDEITCRDLYKSSKTYKPTFTLFTQCNHCPSLDQVDNATKRRFEVLNFPFSFVENPIHKNEKQRDNTIKGKLEKVEYYSQFMGLLIDHIRGKFNERKIIIPDQIKNNTKDYIEENNDVGLFIDQHFETSKGPKDRIKFTDAYNRYCEGEYQKLTKSKFKYNMISNGYELKKYNTGSYYINVIFKMEEDEDNENGCLLDFK